MNGAVRLRNPLSWGAKVTETFRDRVRYIAAELILPAEGASWLMACMAWETGETFSPSIYNGAGSCAVGLIQFMPSIAVDLGTDVQSLCVMSAVQQLQYVHRYFKPYKGKLQQLSDLYMAILWPRAIGRPESYILWDKETKPTTYRQNAGFDADKDASITKAEASAKVYAKLIKGYKVGLAG